MLTTDKPKYAITPKDANGNAVDLSKFPTALTGITWATSDAAVAAVVAAADGLSAEVHPTPAGGSVVVTVSGTNVSGATVTDQVTIHFDVPVPVVTTLNLAPVVAV
jgi:hypothetical protein